MADEVMIHIHGTDSPCELRSCYGNIYKIVNALRDYARMLEMSCEKWKLTGFHLATYELHAQKLRAIADNYQAAIGYDYDAAVKQCRRNMPFVSGWLTCSYDCAIFVLIPRNKSRFRVRFTGGVE